MVRGVIYPLRSFSFVQFSHLILTPLAFANSSVCIEIRNDCSRVSRTASWSLRSVKNMLRARFHERKTLKKVLGCNQTLFLKLGWLARDKACLPLRLWTGTSVFCSTRIAPWRGRTAGKRGVPRSRQYCCTSRSLGPNEHIRHSPRRRRQVFAKIWIEINIAIIIWWALYLEEACLPYVLEDRYSGHLFKWNSDLHSDVSKVCR